MKLTQSISNNEEQNGQWLNKADKLFELLSEKEQTKFLDKIADKVENYNIEKMKIIESLRSSRAA